MGIEASVVGALAGRAAAAVATSLLGEKAKELSLAPEYAFSHLAETLDGEPIIVSERQRVSIESFLERTEVTEILSSWLLLRLRQASPGDETEIVLDDISVAFDDMAVKWTRNLPKEDDWSGRAREIWELATLTASKSTERLRVVISSDPQLEEIYHRHSYGAQLLRGLHHVSPSHIRRLAALLSRPQDLLEVQPLIDAIKVIAAVKFGELNLGHVQDIDDRVDDSLLYVDRIVADSAHNQVGPPKTYIDTSSLISRENVARVVVIGDPGVGKSTLVRHVIYTLATGRDVGIAPLLINCREYAARAGNMSITKYLAETLVADSSTSFSEESLKNLLILGAACVVFDGVDEIVDLQKRRDFIRMIEGFSNSYPYVSVICSTRRVGYQQARFGHGFRVLELDEFTDGEFMIYVEKWFRLTGRDEQEAHGFLRESEDVKDIRKNPLMLSLLCTLYRARGHIPRNRRQVYRDCADLLFVRWDSMRHVEQPYDHRQYGNRVMQELARFFYRSQSAQGGVEEGQLVRLIAHFFRDTASISPPDDENRARQFLDFCAGRAWLLSRKGTNARGVRLFSFTHRTFMEYLAAEALVRSAGDIKAIATTVMEVFLKDPSSVIPDVMVQAADDKFDRGAEQTLRILVEQSIRTRGLSSDKFLALCLRIVNSAPMSRRISDNLPGLLMYFWSGISDVDSTRESTYALFELYRDPRTRIVSALESNEPVKWESIDWPAEEFRTAVARRWIRAMLLDRSETLDPAWRESMNLLYGDTLSGSASVIEVCDNDAVVKDLLLSRDRLSPSDARAHGVMWPAVCISAFGERFGGSVVVSIGNVTSGEESAFSSEIIQWFDEKIGSSALTHVWLPGAYAVADALRHEAEQWKTLRGTRLEAAISGNRGLQRILWWLFCLMEETDRYKHFNTLFGRISTEFSRVAEFREEIVSAVGEGHECTVSELKNKGYEVPRVQSFGLPPWATKWAYACLDLVARPTDELRFRTVMRAGTGRYLAPYILERVT